MEGVRCKGQRDESSERRSMAVDHGSISVRSRVTMTLASVQRRLDLERLWRRAKRALPEPSAQSRVSGLMRSLLRRAA
jgi:hypothetical protein